MKKILSTIFAIFFLPLSVYAACGDVYCTGSPAVCAATDATQAVVNGAIQECLSCAGVGTVNIATDTQTWTSGVAINLSTATADGIIVNGNGKTNTIINSDGTLTPLVTVTMSEGKSFKWNALTLGNLTTTKTGLYIVGASSSTGCGGDLCWRVTNSGFTGAGGSARPYGVFVFGDTYGLIDSNQFTAAKTLIHGSNSGSEILQDARWSVATGLGGANFVFIEDNVFDYTSNTGGNCLDGNYATRFVFRYNTVIDAYLESHNGCANGCRSARAWEIYNNAMSTSSLTPYYAMLMRGGTGVIHDNTVGAGYVQRDYINIDTSSMCDAVDGQCGSYGDGTGINTIYDGLTRPSCTAYPCQDQIGRGIDTGFGTDQALEPVYQWSNTGSVAVTFKEDAGTCAPGAYLTENTDYVNGAKSGYTPYTYPHPLRGTTYTVTPSSGTGYSVSPVGEQTIGDGETTYFDITRTYGYSISVSGCGGSLGAESGMVSRYTTGAIEANCNVTVTATAHLATMATGLNNVTLSTGLNNVTLGN